MLVGAGGWLSNATRSDGVCWWFGRQVFALCCLSVTSQAKEALTAKELAKDAGRAFRKKEFTKAAQLYGQLLAVEPTAKNYYKVRVSAARSVCIDDIGP